MSIYGPSPVLGSDNRYHYVYRITNLVENKHYYGSRTSNISPFDDLGKKYFSSACSNVWIKKDQKKNPQNYKYKILKTFANRKDATEFECVLHDKFDVGNSEHFYNGLKQFNDNHSSVDQVVVRNLETGECLSVPKDDPRYKSGQLVGVAFGKVTVKNPETGKYLSVSKDDPRYTSGQLIHNCVGRVPVRDTETGKCLSVSKDDPRYTSGQLVGVAFGQVTVRDPETGKCYNVFKDDPRFLSGQLVHVVAGQVTVRDPETGKCFNVGKDDPRYTSGQLVHNIAGQIVVVNQETGKYLSVPKDDPRVLSGELKIRSGKYTPRFKHYKRTPWGIFDSLEPEIPISTLLNWCGTDNNRKISKRTYTKYKKLQETFSSDCIGKPYKELGFGLLTPEEYNQLQK